MQMCSARWCMPGYQPWRSQDCKAAGGGCAGGPGCSRRCCCCRCCCAAAIVLTLCPLFPPSAPQYKFIVDSQWRHDPNLPSMYDDMGNINNVLEVQVGAACTAHCGADAPLFTQTGLTQRCTSLLRRLHCAQANSPARSLPSPFLPALQEYVPENLESLAGFDPPPSPPSRSAGCLPGSAGGRLRRP